MKDALIQRIKDVIVSHSRPYRPTYHEDRNVTFMGIPVERYEAPGIEYHLAERGDVW